MDQEIDLRPYLLALMRRWRLILSCVLGLAILGVMVSALIGQGRSASADILIVPISSQVTLDARFQTTNGNQATTPAAQRQALISLASSQVIAQKVVEELGTPARSGSADPIQNLIDQVSVTASSDLLQITVSDPDPAQALKIAEAWGKAYESLVLDVYTRSQFRSDLLDSEIATSQQRYDSAQQSLEAFLSSGESIQVQSQITQLTGLLQGSREAQQLLYTDYLSRTRELSLVIEDAQTLRDQAEAQGGGSFASSFAALLLRARTVDSAALTFQLSAGDLASGSSSGVTKGDLDQLIAVLTRRHEQLSAQATMIASAIANDTGAAAGLDTSTRQRYIDQLATLNSTYEQLQARQSLLTRQRDLARDRLMLVESKRSEQEIARSSPQVEVRFVSASIDPQPSRLFRAALSGAAAGVLGLVLGVALVLLLDMIIPAMRRLAPPASAQPTGRSDTPSDRPIPGD